MLALAHWSCFQQSRKERTILLLKNEVFTFDQGITNVSSHLQALGAMGMGTSHQNDQEQRAFASANTLHL